MVETASTDSLAHSLRMGYFDPLPIIITQAMTPGALCVVQQTLRNVQCAPLCIKITSIVGTDVNAAVGIMCLCDELRVEVKLANGIGVQVGLDRLVDAMTDSKLDSRIVIVGHGGRNS